MTRVWLHYGPSVLGKEVISPLRGHTGQYHDSVDGERLWNMTGRVTQEAYADDYSEGKEYRASKSGAVVCIPGRVKVDESFNSPPALQLLTRDECKLTTGVSSAKVDWAGVMWDKDIAVKKRSLRPGEGYVGFRFVMPCLRSWLPERSYAKTRHIQEALVGVIFEGCLYAQGSAPRIDTSNGQPRAPGAAAKNSGPPIEAASVQVSGRMFQMQYRIYGPPLDARKIQGMDLSQLPSVIKSVWFPQAHTVPDKWNVIYVRTSGNRDPAPAQVEEPIPAHLLAQDGDGFAVGTWSCSVCTFENVEPLQECELCGAARGATAIQEESEEVVEEKLEKVAARKEAALFASSSPGEKQILDRGQKVKLQVSIEKGELNKDLLKELGGSRHGVPNSVFRLFEKCKLLSRSNFSSADERAQIVWAMKECGPVCKDPQSELFFLWLANSLYSNQALKTAFAEHCAENAGNRKMIQDMQERPYLGAAWLAVDVAKHWEALPPVDRKFFEDAAPRLMRAAPWTDFTVDELEGILDRVRGRYICIDKVIRNREPKLALFFLRRTPMDILVSTWEIKNSNLGFGSQTGSFFDLYEPFAQIADHEAAEDLVVYLSSAYLMQNKDPRPALMSFMSKPLLVRQGEAAGSSSQAPPSSGRWKRDLLISFISAWNIKENFHRNNPNAPRPGSASPASSPAAKSEPSGGKRASWFGGFGRVSTSKDETGSPASVASSPQVSVIPCDFSIPVMELLLTEYAQKSSLSREDRDQLRELFECGLLCGSRDLLAAWATQDLSGSKLDLMSSFMQQVGCQHVSDVLRYTATSIGDYEYKEPPIKKMCTEGDKWFHDHYGSRYFSERKDGRPTRCQEICQLLRMYVKLDVALRSGTLWTFVQGLEQEERRAGSWNQQGDHLGGRLAKIAPGGSSLRLALSKEVARLLPQGLLADNEIAICLEFGGFFDPVMQNLLKDAEAVKFVRSNLAKPSDFNLLLLATVKISSIKGIQCKTTPADTLRNVATMCKSHTFIMESMRTIFHEVLKRPTNDFRPESETGQGFSINSFYECAMRLQLASEVIDFKSKGGKVDNTMLIENVKNVVDSFLRSPPVTWETYLGSLDAYQKLEDDIKRAMKEADTDTEKRKNQQLLDLVDCVKQVYTETLVHVDVKNVGQLQSLDIAQVIKESAKKLDKPVTWCGATFTPEDWDDIVEIAGTTARAMQEKFTVLMLPHHTQMITLIILAIRTCGLNSPGLPKTMLGRVGTGEGKSWIIGMLAAFVVKRGRRTGTGLRAHVVIDNATLKSRDFDTVSLFFDKLKMKASKSMEHLHDPEYEIVYCTGAEIWNECRARLEQGQPSEEFERSMSNVVLIVDEVDGLIIDGDANIQYMYPDEYLSEHADHWLRLLENGMNPDEPNDADELIREELRIAFHKVEEAYGTAKDAVKGRDFEWRGDFMYMIDKSTGMIKVGWWDLWYEIRYWIDTEWQGVVTYKSIKSILCKKHCFTSYSCIFGLTGSLGQRAEQSFLLTHYDAAAFNVPCFLDTCISGGAYATGKPVVKSLNNGDVVQLDEDGQMEKVVQLASSKCDEVPVLIIAKDQTKVEQVATMLCNKLGLSPAVEMDTSGDRVLRLLEDPGNPDKFVRMVQQSTQPWNSVGAKKGQKKWKITVTTAEGGRGHDYRCVDPAIDEKGGMLLILMWVSWSQREWVQFLGRTARQDHEGQMAVFLNGQSKEVFDLEVNDVDLRDGDKVVQSILDCGDAKMAEKCQKIGGHISRGTLMHRLTSRYWHKHNAEGSTNSHEENLWRKLCRDYLQDGSTEENMLKDFNAIFPKEVSLAMKPASTATTASSLGREVTNEPPVGVAAVNGIVSLDGLDEMGKNEEDSPAKPVVPVLELWRCCSCNGNATETDTHDLVFTGRVDNIGGLSTGDENDAIVMSLDGEYEEESKCRCA
eukprot:TRINITY_DN3161_c0_g4_i1.p1 TRINITY_DN3161_c0_g4~~TRINITY_DN3161_c0_g4_i1.p1  ORF type:complete len:1922 (+),score=477.26 TRINITY_DN3161_c0_g4_i1:213-5978(+)